MSVGGPWPGPGALLHHAGEALVTPMPPLLQPTAGSGSSSLRMREALLMAWQTACSQNRSAIQRSAHTYNPAVSNLPRGGATFMSEGAA